jgi:YaiO family outer membrane protein
VNHFLTSRGGSAALILLMLLLECSARAQETEVIRPHDRNSIDFGGEYQSLSSRFGNWNAFYLRGVFPQKTHDNWNAEITHRTEFGDGGTYFAAGDTHNFTDDWYASASLGASAGGFFLPRYRIDAALNKKWRRQRNLVTTLGFMHAKAKDVHRDNMLSVGAAYYWERQWILEGAVQFNFSHPGPVFSESQFIVVTHGKDRARLITLRAAFGTEAYQLIGATNVLSQFSSQSVSLTWRQWIAKTWGWNCAPEYYHSPAYQRGGFTLGIFHEF